jgi:ADP-ribose pyrophosphatase YjhB (NUDIX family)
LREANLWADFIDEERFQVGAKALVRNTEGRVLLAKSSSGRWDLPGGRINIGEQVEEALRREIREELGVEEVGIGALCDAAISNVRVRSEGVEYRLCILVYRCSIDAKKLVPGKGCEEYRWVSSGEAGGLLAGKYQPDFVDRLLGQGFNV